MSNLLQHAKHLKNTEVIETTEYGVFILDIKNRPINDGKVNHWMKVFQDGKNFMKEFPAVVSEGFVILDGQHRFVASKKLGIPFHFRFTGEMTIDDVVSVQTNSGWATMDYVHSFIQQKNMNYIILHRFIKKYGIPASTAVILLGGKKSAVGGEGGSLNKLGFYEGNFVVKSEKWAHELAETVLDFVELGFKSAKNRNFIFALIKIYQNPEYNHARMMDKMKSFGASILHPQINVEYYLRNLEELYNYKQAAGTRIRFI